MHFSSNIESLDARGATVIDKNLTFYLISEDGTIKLEIDSLLSTDDMVIKAEHIETFPSKTADPNDLVTKLNDKKLYTCTVCSNAFLTRDKMVEHKKIHKFEKRFQCTHCALRFKTKGILLKHLKLVHSCSDQSTCQFCYQTFTQNINFLPHETVNELNNKDCHSCNTCDKVFMYKKDLLKHIKEHDPTKEDKFYSCDICNKSFVKESEMTEHSIVHKSLTQKDNLEPTETLLQNIGENFVTTSGYSCNVCDKVFVKKLELVEHKRIHKDERNFKCDHCYRGFKTKSILKKHLKLMHSCIDQDTCEFCNKSFSLDKLKTYVESKYDFDLKVEPEYIDEDLKNVLQENSFNISLNPSIYLKVADVQKMKILYFCEKCIITFETDELYETHMQTHSSQDNERENHNDNSLGGGEFRDLF